MNPGYHFSLQADKVSALELFEKRRTLTRYERRYCHCVDWSRSTILFAAGDVITLVLFFFLSPHTLESFILLTCCKRVWSTLSNDLQGIT